MAVERADWTERTERLRRIGIAGILVALATTGLAGDGAGWAAVNAAALGVGGFLATVAGGLEYARDPLPGRDAGPVDGDATGKWFVGREWTLWAVGGVALVAALLPWLLSWPAASVDRLVFSKLFGLAALLVWGFVGGIGLAFRRG